MVNHYFQNVTVVCDAMSLKTAQVKAHTFQQHVDLIAPHTTVEESRINMTAVCDNVSNSARPAKVNTNESHFHYRINCVSYRSVTRQM